MKFLSVLNAMIIVPTVLSSQVPDTKRDVIGARDEDRGQYTVAGLGARKQAVLNVGGNTRDLAIAMLETYVYPNAT